MATSPTTAPVAAPTAVAWPPRAYSMRSQAIIAAAAAAWVVTNALAATPSAASADPPLNPNQPTQRSAAPNVVSTTLCGREGVWPALLLGPTNAATTNAAVPALM